MFKSIKFKLHYRFVYYGALKLDLSTKLLVSYGNASNTTYDQRTLQVPYDAVNCKDVATPFFKFVLVCCTLNTLLCILW